jgi:Holliday junction resolvasome RuvABC endonuclease subunit
MIVLGLDPSLRAYGWAVYDSKAKPKRKRIASGYEATLSSQVPVARFIHFRAMVKNLLEKYEIEAVGIESPAYGGGPFSETHFGLMMFSIEVIFEKRLDCVLFDPETLKFLAKVDPKKRKGKMNKIDMQRYVSIDTNTPKLINNNEADAYCVAKFSSRLIHLVNGDIDPEDLTESEKWTFMDKAKKRKNAKKQIVVKRTAHIFRENSRFFRFSKIPEGNVNLPEKDNINPALLKYLT